MAWIKIDRQITDHWIWGNPIYLKAWLTLIITVNFEEKKSLIHGELIICKRGQSLLSVNNWVKKFGKGWSIQKVRTFFELLKNDSMIELEGLRKTTRLTICKYETYQDVQQTNNRQVTDKQQTSNRQVTTTKEREERKERKKENLLHVKDINIPESKFQKYEKWLRTNCHNVARLEIQMTEENFNALLSKYDSQLITDKVLAMENKKDLNKKYKSVYLTLNTWLKQK